jgi:predicted RNase H-like HicB family nuclease
MRYPIALETGDETHALGVAVPDLPGCFSAGDTLDEALANAEEAILGRVETTLDSGAETPPPSSLDALRAAHPEYRDWVWAVVSVDPAALDDTVERVNISLAAPGAAPAGCPGEGGRRKPLGVHCPHGAVVMASGCGVPGVCRAYTHARHTPDVTQA